MKCAQACALLGDHLEGNLALQVRTEIDEHLHRCAECKRELHELRSTVALLRSLPTPEPPPNLVADVMERIDSGETRIARLPAGFRRVFDPRVAAPLAAGIAGLVLFATMNDGFGTPVDQRLAAISGSSRSASALSTPADAAANRGATRSRIVDRIERRMWEDKPATLPRRAITVKHASAPRSAGFRVQPRLPSTEQNLAIRLFPSNRRGGVGFYGRTDPDPQYLDLDSHIDRAKAQPEVFLAAVGSTDEADRRTFIAPFAARAARRGDGQVVAGRLRRASHPQARSAADLFEQSWRRTHTRPAQPTFSR